MKINLSNERLASQGSFDLSLTCESLESDCIGYVVYI